MVVKKGEDERRIFANSSDFARVFDIYTGTEGRFSFHVVKVDGEEALWMVSLPWVPSIPVVLLSPGEHELEIQKNKLGYPPGPTLESITIQVNVVAGALYVLTKVENQLALGLY